MANPDEPLRDELFRDERLIWSGQPFRGYRASPPGGVGLVFVIVILVIWTVFTVLFTANTILHRGWSDASMPALAGALGLFLLAYAVWGEPRKWQQTFYGLTDQRVIIRSGLTRPTVTSLPLHSMVRIELRADRHGVGAIAFHDFGVPCGYDGTCVPELRGLEEARVVYALIQTSKAQADPPEIEPWTPPKLTRWPRSARPEDTG